MKYAEFRALETGAKKHKADDLLAAAVSAFSINERPSAQERQQFNDLAIPLLAYASLRARRQAAAILSESALAPKELLLALADDLIEVAAPVLLRSPLLTSTDLAAVIESRGLGHARVIARRPLLDGDLLERLARFEDDIIDDSLSDRAHRHGADQGDESGRPSRIEETRAALRTMMVPSQTDPSVLADKLINAVFLDDPAFFQIALANALKTTLGQSKAIIGRTLRTDFILALRALDIRPSDAHLIITARFGPVLTTRPALRTFIDDYRALSQQAARDAIAEFKSETLRTGDDPIKTDRAG
ncbi:MAG: hypothetical protein ACRECW_15990 [Phyllobacterium sp.]